MGASKSKLEPLRTVKSFQVPKLMGKWFVVGVIPTYFEKGADNPVETYTWEEKTKSVKVDFTYSYKGKPKSLPQRLYTTGYPESKGTMKVSPFWPVKLPFLLMEVSEDYKYCMIGYPSRAYLWIMSRTPSMDETTYEKYVKIAADQKYDPSAIVKPKHDDPADSKPGA
mmetsp:Transcript_17238/g.25861  ORF Transcript_17238/g.25861 Transcript_17238/m.25861 type:complete len:168 (+) Transcript_17238:206-709(+)|eukprot:CAMPEP_0167754860 /NCGR_PEP_ID=MMETSP0110_2-20121227/8505_1 /TAXON_ID=629695 /ORGANISM="Gymnochlora sp., Strain CCMP2014" /LENGTH=167 /DNA_ID=CAMNT_0007640787 /DNA_START=145 /DNA_END=648 /DNA_ORIENTATION=+